MNNHSAHLLLKVFHGLMLLLCIYYTGNSQLSIRRAVFFSPPTGYKLHHDTLFNNNKPHLQCVKTHEQTFSTHIAEGISWSDVTSVYLLHW